MPARAVEAAVAARSGASNDKTGVAVEETRGARGEAAVVIKKVGIEIDTTHGSDDAARLLAQDVTQEVDEEVETDDSASTRTVKAPARQSIEELREVKPARIQALTPWGGDKFCVQTLTPWGGGEFREVKVSAPAKRLAARHEGIGLDIRRRDGQTRLALMGEDPERSEERP